MTAAIHVDAQAEAFARARAAVERSSSARRGFRTGTRCRGTPAGGSNTGSGRSSASDCAVAAGGREPSADNRPGSAGGRRDPVARARLQPGPGRARDHGSSRHDGRSVSAPRSTR